MSLLGQILKNNKLRNKGRYWGKDSEQLVMGVENATFSKSVVLDHLNYDLAADY